MTDVMAGRALVNFKIQKLRGRSIVTVDAGTAAITIGLLGGILTYAVNLSITDKNPTHDIKRPKYHPRRRRLSENEYRVLGQLLHDAEAKAEAEPDKRSDVAVIGLHTVFEHHAAMTATSLEAFLLEYRIGFPVGVDAHEGSSSTPITMTRYGLCGTPSLVLIDRVGLIRFRGFGHEPDLALGARIAQVIAQHDVGVTSAENSVKAACVPGEGCQ